jgi:hypothetical protein
MSWQIPHDLLSLAHDSTQLLQQPTATARLLPHSLRARQDYTSPHQDEVISSLSLGQHSSSPVSLKPSPILKLKALPSTR